MANAIECKNLMKKYGTEEVLNDINFSVKQGEIFGFLGRNGAGKSTLINILSGIHSHSNGEFYILGSNSSTLNNVKKNIGIFPDINNFYNELSALEHLRYFARLQKLEVNNDQFIQLLKQVGLQDKRKKVKKYSFGMKKKLGVAQALLNDPDLLILDEPTSGLDPESAIEMKTLFKQLVTNGKTIFTTSHNLNEIEEISDRVAILKKGKITSIGTMNELRKQNQALLKIEITTNVAVDKDWISTLITHPVEVKNNKLVVTVETESDISPILLNIINQGYKVYYVEPQKMSLEDIFLKEDDD